MGKTNGSFKKGHKGYWLGKKVPRELIIKRAIASAKSRTGLKLSESHKENLRKAKLGKKGELANNWQGGLTKNKEHKAQKYKEWKMKNPDKYKKSGLDYRTRKREKLAGRSKSDKCEICGSGKEGKICYDHDHKTGKFRGWICHNCNLTLGLIKDDVEILKKMVEYLRG